VGAIVWQNQNGTSESRGQVNYVIIESSGPIIDHHHQSPEVASNKFVKIHAL